MVQFSVLVLSIAERDPRSVPDARAPRWHLKGYSRVRCAQDQPKGSFAAFDERLSQTTRCLPSQASGLL